MWLVVVNLFVLWFVVQYLIGWRNLFNNIKKHGFKYVTSDRANLVLDWADIQKNGITLKSDQIETFAENVMFRKIMCEECDEAGKCVDCSCDFNSLISTPSAECSLGRWDKMILDKEEWEEYLSKNAIGVKFGFVRDGKE